MGREADTPLGGKVRDCWSSRAVLESVWRCTESRGKRNSERADHGIRGMQALSLDQRHMEVSL